MLAHPYVVSMWSYDESHPGSFLRNRFFVPLGLSTIQVAHLSGLAPALLKDVVAARLPITAEVALRLAALFRMDPIDLLQLQARWDLSQAAVSEIEPLDPPGFLIGPLGATPIPSGSQGEVQPHEEQSHKEVRYPDGTRALIARRRI